MGCASQYSKSQRSEKQRSKKGTVGVESVKGMLLENFFKQQLVDSITTAKAAAFVEWLAKKLQPITMRERLVMLKSCWDWGISKQLAVENP